MTLLTSLPPRRVAVSSAACVLGACGVGTSGGHRALGVRRNTTAETYVFGSRKYITLDYLMDASTGKYLLALVVGYSEKASVNATGHKSSSEETQSMDRAKAMPVREDGNDNDVSCVDDTALLLSSSGRDGQLIYFRCTNHLNHLG
ncbi:hypothetical protein ABZP36_018151 [Zizania latifolia]